MGHPATFTEALDAVDRLSAEEQQTLLEIMQRRIAERGRKQLAAEIKDARQQFTSSGCTPATPDELMGEILA